MAIELNINDSMITDMLEPMIREQVNARFSDSQFVSKIESLVQQQVNARLEKLMENIDIDRRVDGKIKELFTSGFKGIASDTSNVQLTIMDDTVVNENEFVTKSLRVMDDANLESSLTVNDLIVKGRVNTDNASWNELSDKIKTQTVREVHGELRAKITSEVIKEVQSKGIKLENVKVNGVDLITDGVLGATVKYSNLERLGTLKDLTVAGATSLSDTVTVRNNRVGINTENPTSALDIWEDDTRLSLGKKNKDTTQISTNNRLEIATGDTAITIDDTGKVTIKELMVGRNNISFGKQVPNYSGQKGDIVFNMNPSPGAPLGWQCLGSFRWRVIEWNSAG